MESGIPYNFKIILTSNVFDIEKKMNHYNYSCLKISNNFLMATSVAISEIFNANSTGDCSAVWTLKYGCSRIRGLFAQLVRIDSDQVGLSG